MDVGMSNEVTAIEVINGTHLQSKEREYSLKPSSSNMLKLNEMVIPGDCDDYKNSPGFLADTLDSTNLDRIGASEHACASPRRMDDAGVMVEELTLRNYSTDNLAVVGTSSNRDKMQTRQSKWQKLYQIAGGSRTGVSHGDAAYRVNGGKMTNFWEDSGYTVNPEFLDRKPLNNCNDVAENMLSNIKKPVSSNALLSACVMRTKILSQSGFSDYFVKNTLQGKGVICRGPASEALGYEFKDQTYSKAAGVAKVDPGALLSSKRETFAPPSHGTPKPFSGLCPDVFHDGISLREWLKSGQSKVNKVKSLYIFRQIVDMVNNSHSQGVTLLDLRPSYFKLLLSDEVMYLGSSVQREIIEKLRDKDVLQPENGKNGKRPLEQGSFTAVSQWARKRKPEENTKLVSRWPQFPTRSGVKYANETDVNIAGPQFSGNEFNVECNPTMKYRTESYSRGLHVFDSSESLLTYASDPSETKWYASPEELNERSYTLSSNIYCLGVLLFELLCSFDSGRAHAVAMLDLCHRILPPVFLSENPKEAGFCLWLLHPEPSSCPTTK